VEPGADRVDAVPVERLAHLVEVLVRELARVVELVVVDQVAQAFDGTAHALHGRLPRVLGLIAARHEARDHRPEGPDAEAGAHALSGPRAPGVDVRWCRASRRRGG
jgi:hypothetical protein